MLALLSEKPMVIIANTIKGKGIKLMENSPEWHHKSPSIEELSAIYKELGYAKAIC
jgi:transketolase